MINDSIKFTHRHHQATIIIIAGKWQQYTRVWPQCVNHARMRMDWIRFDSIDEQTDRQTSVHAFWFVCATLLLLAFFRKFRGCCYFDMVVVGVVTIRYFQNRLLLMVLRDRQTCGVLFFGTYLWALFHFSFVVVAVVLIVICLILAIICLICS